MKLTFLGAAGTVTGSKYLLEASGARILDQAGLLAWLRGSQPSPRQVFITHGEAVAADTLRQRVQDEIGCCVHVPEYRESVQLV